MTTRPLCIHHDKCPDGFTAAWAVARHFKGEVDHLAANYGHPVPSGIDGRDVIIVDFSWPQEQLEEIARRARTLVVLDHHKSAEASLAEFGETVSSGDGLALWQRMRDGGEPARPLKIFDMDRSGARLAWDFLGMKGPGERLVNYVQDRDLWTWRLPRSREINALVCGTPFTMENWDMLSMRMDNEPFMLADLGGAILMNQEKILADTLPEVTRRMVIGGYEVPVANLPHFMASDAAHILDRGEPFAAVYYDRRDGRKFSLRSSGEEGSADVSAIAALYGGGGHRNAASFVAPLGWEGEPAPEADDPRP
ncbi:phosphohydrolase [Cereibacter sphaeroides]|uniref:phosphohydrolase n=1 Tax=Cereibacter sphaeroides TaxID=1063 RepID=UPI001F360591|nr:phosphohydrolase [Cereibacter sphaeroides]MCE6958261.1 phosphohydrolase [Cereibacter sphaeroides]MCE6971200.1 phosphohydrolase [Cereibacter sphaeroides]